MNTHWTMLAVLSAAAIAVTGCQKSADPYGAAPLVASTPTPAAEVATGAAAAQPEGTAGSQATPANSATEQEKPAADANKDYTTTPEKNK